MTDHGDRGSGRDHEHDATDGAEGDASHGDLRGSFTAVMLMAAFFVAAWLGMFALAMERRG